MSSSRSDARSRVWRHAALVLAVLAITVGANWGHEQKTVGVIVTDARSTVIPVATSLGEIVGGMRRIDRIPLSAWDLQFTYRR